VSWALTSIFDVPAWEDWCINSGSTAIWITNMCYDEINVMYRTNAHSVPYMKVHLITCPLNIPVHRMTTTCSSAGQMSGVVVLNGVIAKGKDPFLRIKHYSCRILLYSNMSSAPKVSEVLTFQSRHNITKLHLSFLYSYIIILYTWPIQYPSRQYDKKNPLSESYTHIKTSLLLHSWWLRQPLLMHNCGLCTW